jgi:hypothetical protein
MEILGEFSDQFLQFVAGKKMIVEKLWQEFFMDPSQWWDNRPEKVLNTCSLLDVIRKLVDCS